MSADTIYALGTGGQRAAIAIFRLSGSLAQATLQALAGGLPEPRLARYCAFRDPDTGEVLDRGLALWFPAPHSATGEDYAEIHIHGGRAVVGAFLKLFGRRPGLRAAEPGEFARRGFANGKMDLSQIEALADLIDAQTEFQRRQALRIAGGELRRRVEAWRKAIVESLALIEAELDFADEGDVGGGFFVSVQSIVAPIIVEMRAALQQAQASEQMRDGYVVLILGPPNAGKSTLMNAMAGREAAIVSAIPGTTRDMIEVHLDLGGCPVTLVDSAGLREARDEIEQIGIARTLERIGKADLLLWLSEGGAAPVPEEIAAGAHDVEVVRVSTKADLHPPAAGLLAVSAKTGDGLEYLLDRIAERARESVGDGTSALFIRQRHRDAARTALAGLEHGLVEGRPLEIAADDLRIAGRALARIVGAIDPEEVLEVIFARFCIGK